MKLKKVLRILLLVFMLALALSGIGPPPPRFFRDFDNEVKVELVEKRQEDEITDVDSEKEVKS